MQNYFIAIDIGGTNLRFALIDNNQNIIKKSHVFTSNITNGSIFLDTLKREVKELNNNYNAKKISIVIPAPYNEVSKKIVDITNIPCIENLSYTEIRNALCEYDVCFQNDVNVVALLECKLGAGKGCNNLVYITFSTGIGSGIILKGEIHNGTNGYAGEVGSFVIDSTRENFLDGTFENLCSGTALTNIAKKNFGKDKTCKYIFSMYEKKEDKSQKIIKEWLRNVSTGIANIVQLLDPDIIVLGGPIITCNQWLVEEICAHTRKKLLGKLSTKLKIKINQFGSDAGLIGASYYAQINFSRRLN
ncbi:MAG: ROK family protein [Lachnospirales bacterium]